MESNLVTSKQTNKQTNKQTKTNKKTNSIMSRFLKKSRASVNNDDDDAESVADSSFTSTSSNWRTKLTSTMSSTARGLHDEEIVRNSLDYQQNPLPPLPPSSHTESCTHHNNHYEIIEIKVEKERLKKDPERGAFGTNPPTGIGVASNQYPRSHSVPTFLG